MISSYSDAGEIKKIVSRARDNNVQQSVSALYRLPLKPSAASGRLSPQTVLIELLPRYCERVTENNVRNNEGAIER